MTHVKKNHAHKHTSHAPQSSEKIYRKQLEQELERLTKELKEIRLEKAKQKHRVESLRQEQVLLEDQVTSGDHETIRSGLVQEVKELQDVVQTKAKEHAKVQQEWERSQEQYHQLHRTVDLLKGSTLNGLMQREEGKVTMEEPAAAEAMKSKSPKRNNRSTLVESSDSGMTASTDSLSSQDHEEHKEPPKKVPPQWQESNQSNTSSLVRTDLFDTIASQGEVPENMFPTADVDSQAFDPGQYLWDDDVSCSTNLTDYTKDSLQVYAGRQAKGSVTKNAKGEGFATASSLGNHFSKNSASRTFAADGMSASESVSSSSKKKKKKGEQSSLQRSVRNMMAFLDAESIQEEVE